MRLIKRVSKHCRYTYISIIHRSVGVSNHMCTSSKTKSRSTASFPNDVIGIAYVSINEVSLLPTRDDPDCDSYRAPVQGERGTPTIRVIELTKCRWDGVRTLH